MARSSNTLCVLGTGLRWWLGQGADVSRGARPRLRGASLRLGCPPRPGGVRSNSLPAEGLCRRRRRSAARPRLGTGVRAGEALAEA